MSNKEFVEDLVKILNILTMDRLMNQKPTDALTQRFELVERVHTVNMVSKEMTPEYVHHVDVTLLIKYQECSESRYAILQKFNMVYSSTYPECNKEDIDRTYEFAKINILKNILFLKECIYTTGTGTNLAIPVNAIIKEGYKYAKDRILHESK